jgi:hypothetical protein
MSPNQTLICRIALEPTQKAPGQSIQESIAQSMGPAMAQYVANVSAALAQHTSAAYALKDTSGNLALEIRKAGGPISLRRGAGGRTELAPQKNPQYQVLDPILRTPVGLVDLTRGTIGGLKATWIAPTGQTLMSSKGNIASRQYEILGPTGQPVGHVQTKNLPAPDFWGLDLGPESNRLFTSIFATVLDIERES